MISKKQNINIHVCTCYPIVPTQSLTHSLTPPFPFTPLPSHSLTPLPSHSPIPPLSLPAPPTHPLPGQPPENSLWPSEALQWRTGSAPVETGGKSSHDGRWRHPEAGYSPKKGRREGGRKGRREGGREGRREGGKEKYSEGDSPSLIPRPPLATFFLQPWKNGCFSMAVKKAARGGLGTRLRFSS